MAKNFISDFFKKDDPNDVSTVFTSSKFITANNAYRISKYGEIKTDKQLLEDFFYNVKELIQIKNQKGKYCGIVELKDDIIQYIPQIKQRLMNDLGFKVVVLNDNSIIIDNENHTEEHLSAGTTFILLIWTKDAIEDVAHTYKNLSRSISNISSVTENVENCMTNKVENEENN